MKLTAIQRLKASKRELNRILKIDNLNKDSSILDDKTLRDLWYLFDEESLKDAEKQHPKKIKKIIVTTKVVKKILHQKKPLSKRSKEILLVIDRQKETYASEIAAQLKNNASPDSAVPYAWISNRITHLKKMGFIAKKKRGRIKLILLTDKGKEMVVNIKKENKLCGISGTGAI